MVTGVMRAAAEMSLTGGHVLFPWRFAIFAQVLVVMRLYQASPMSNACDEGEIGVCCGSRRGSKHVLVFL